MLSTISESCTCVRALVFEVYVTIESVFKRLSSSDFDFVRFDDIVIKILALLARTLRTDLLSPCSS